MPRRASAAGLLLLAPLGLLLLLAALCLLLACYPPRPAVGSIRNILPLTHARPTAILLQSLYVAGHSRPHPELCPALGACTQLVILVASAPAHAAARQAVRLTWGHAALRADVTLAFVLGAPPPELRAALDAEDAFYGDLVEGRFVDSYRNLTLKTVYMLEWFNTYCPRAPRMLKADDDVFINVPKLLKFVEDPARRNATNTVWGKVQKHSSPNRDPRHKRYIPLEQFPGKVCPDYTLGAAYLVTADAARRLLRAAPGERFLPLEDVFVTGVLAARLGVRRVTQVPEFFINAGKLDPCDLQNIIAFHRVEYKDQFNLWQELRNGKTQCAAKLRGYVYGTVAD